VMVHLQQLLLKAAHVWLEDHSEKLGFTWEVFQRKSTSFQRLIQCWQSQPKPIHLRDDWRHILPASHLPSAVPYFLYWHGRKMCDVRWTPYQQPPPPSHRNAAVTLFLDAMPCCGISAWLSASMRGSGQDAEPLKESLADQFLRDVWWSKLVLPLS
jgi:hypothetical protein